MQIKNDNPVKYLLGLEIDPIVKLYYEFNHLKQLYREGWLKKGRDVPKEKCESVGDHIMGVAFLCLFIVPEYFSELNLEKVLSLALIHDLGEIYGGDITPLDNISDEDKHQIEGFSMMKVLYGFPNWEKYLDLWEEFEEDKTPEAKFVKQIDKLEMAFQASIYQNQGYINAKEFFDSADKKISSETLTQLLNSIKETIKK